MKDTRNTVPPQLMDQQRPESFHAAPPMAGVQLQPPTVTTNAFGETPLFRASWMGQTATVQTLLTMNHPDGGAAANPNHADQNGCTPLHYTSCAATVQALLAAGADPTHADRYGNTPLHAAAMAGDVDVARVLLLSSCSPTTTTTTSTETTTAWLLYARNVHGETPLDRCRVLRRTQMAQFLLQQYAHNVLLAQQHSDQAIRAVLQEAVYHYPVNNNNRNTKSNDPQEVLHSTRKAQPLRIQLPIGTVSVEQFLMVLDLILHKDPTAIFGSFQAAIQWGAPPQVLYYLLCQDPEPLLQLDSQNRDQQ